MPTTLRQRHGHHNDESSPHHQQQQRININNEYDDVNESSIIYNPKKTNASSLIIKIAPWSLVFGVLGLILLLHQGVDWSRGTMPSSATTQAQDTNNNLKLITVYPWPIAKTIHHIEGQTELLISNDNREGIDAVRTSIAMANSLRRKRRHRNLLLRITNVIAAILTSRRQSGSVDDTSSNNGDVELEAYGEAKMREYLLEHGEKCSFDDDHHRGKSSGSGSISSDIIQLIDSIYSSNNEVNNDEIENNFVWDVVIRLFTWCQLFNGHARGYITHGTFLNIQHVLEDCRLRGVGVIADTAQSMNGLHYSPLFIIPSQSENNDGARSSRDVSLQSLQSYLAMWRTTVDSSPPMSFAVEGRYLNQWTPEQYGAESDGGGVAEGWLLLK